MLLLLMTFTDAKGKGVGILVTGMSYNANWKGSWGGSPHALSSVAISMAL